MRQKQAERSHDQRCRSRDQKGLRRCFNAELSDDQADGDPGKGAEHSYQRETPRVGYILKRQRCCQRQSREIAEAISQHQKVNRAEGMDARHQIKEYGADQMKSRQHAFSGKETVRDQAHKQRRDHGCQRGGAEHGSGFCPGEVERRCKICADGHVPAAPNHKIKKHHHAETNVHRVQHGRGDLLRALGRLVRRVNQIGQVANRGADIGLLLRAGNLTLDGNRARIV